MNVVALPEARDLPRDLDVVSVVFTPEATHVDLQSQATGKTWRVRFHGAEGHRVLDEGDLLEFWPHCSTPNGVIFRIENAGWFEQESQRQGFLKRDTQPQMPEYFVAGENACVSVLSHSPPDLFELPRSTSKIELQGVHGAA
jgi:hypothetical protein